MSDHFDLAIIGSGPGGYVAAIRAAQLGLSTAIIEKDKLGGVCLNIGCIPSKALIHNANVFRSRTHLESLGVKVDVSSFDYSRVHSLSRTAADTLSRGVGYLMKKNKVTIINGTASFVSPHELIIDNGQTVSAKKIIIATGSRPRQIPGFEFDEQTVLSSTGALMLQQLPSSMLILGGGAIGVEFAHIMNAFGVRVHLVEMLDRILPLEDADTVDVLRKSFQKRGITITTSTKAVAMSRESGKVTVVLEDREKKQSSLDVDKVLVVVGRVPNTESIGLEKIGIATEKGYITVGDYGMSSVTDVYAIGDVVPTPLLAHVASREGEMAVEHIAGHPPHSPGIDLHAIPGAVYCEPQIASFGITEQQAKEANIDYKASVFPYRGAGKSVAIGASDGFYKLITNKATGELLGAHGVGAEATELIHELLLAKTSELLPQDIAETIHAHPTLSEVVKETALAALGRAIHI